MKPAKRRAIRAAARASVFDHEPMAMTTRYHRICQHCGAPTLLPAAHFDLCHGVVLHLAQAERQRKAKSAGRPRRVATPQGEAAVPHARVLGR